MPPYDQCACQSNRQVDSDHALAVLGDIRSACPVLATIMLPDGVWTDFQRWHEAPDLVAFHRSVILLAVERGYLARVTSPLHRYLMEGDCVRPSVRAQYLRDLQERWVQDEDPIGRHRQSKRFRSRLAELQFAQWLDRGGTPVTGLEALGASADVESRPAEGPSTTFEVKFIGSEDADFSLLLEAFAGRPSGGFVSLPAAANYLIFRTYEAAKQLASVEGDRIASIIIDEIGWWRFAPTLEHHWIDWTHPQFSGGDPQWGAFMEEQARRWPNLPSDLPSTLSEISQVWILRQGCDFEFTLVATPAISRPSTQLS